MNIKKYYLKNNENIKKIKNNITIFNLVFIMIYKNYYRVEYVV